MPTEAEELLEWLNGPKENPGLNFLYVHFEINFAQGLTVEEGISLVKAQIEKGEL